ncbi:MAG: glycosyltransferase [Tannerella sp.]|jgi:glycosyltransferase involved in cell wall biosynthesis|nr:glycosyltransferase [Tannerella sp.]
MKILLVNKFYYPRGGDCTAVMSTEELLRAKGHQVAIFSVKHPENVASPFQDYFPQEVDFFNSGLAGKLSGAKRIFYSSEVARLFKRLLTDFQPDVVHLHNIHSYLSPIVAQIAHKQGIKVVWTLHDYKLICPAYTCLRDGKPCELCFKSKFQVVKRRCMKGSLPASILAYAEAVWWNRHKLEMITDTFISPSNFLKDKMLSAGFQSDKITMLSNFMSHQPKAVLEKDDYYCYVGRLSEEKGIEMLLETAFALPYPLKIIGNGTSLDTLRKRYNHPNIQFLGQMPHEQLFPIVGKARFAVVPSVWYENNPYSAIEALCMGTPVLGASIGGIPELVEEGVNGMTFEAGKKEELAAKIHEMFRKPFNYSEIALKAQTRFSADTFYTKLMNIYKKILM